MDRVKEFLSDLASTQARETRSVVLQKEIIALVEKWQGRKSFRKAVAFMIEIADEALEATQATLDDGME